MRTVPGCGCFFGIIFIPYTSGSIPALAISAWFPPIPFSFSCLRRWSQYHPPLLKSQKPPPSPAPHLCDQRALERIPSTDICHRSVFLNNKPMLIPPFTTACFPFTAASIAELVPATGKKSTTSSHPSSYIQGRTMCLPAGDMVATMIKLYHCTTLGASLPVPRFS